MRIVIHCIGHLKEGYWKAAQEEYGKRLKGYAELTIKEYPDYPTPNKAGAKEETEIKNKEGQAILKALKPSDYLVILDLNHPEVDSLQFAEKLNDYFRLGGSTVHFAIGGSLGLSDELKKRANAVLCFGKMTFPHQLARIMLLEQLYRAFRINNHEPYHK